MGEIMANRVLERAADNMRILSAAMVEKAKSGHPGGAMGGADFINVLYAEFLRFDPNDMNWAFRDRFFLDPGHMSPMLYSQLHMIDKFSREEIENFRQWGSPTHGHPEVSVMRGIENSSGPLGIGHAMGLGAAIAERFYAERFGEWTSHKTYAFISDGGMQEEISQGVGRIAGHLGLANFIMFYDSNDIQLSHTCDHTITEDTEAKYRSWGWRVETINGNDADEIREALKRANAETEKPTLIIGKTIMGKGALAEDSASFEKKVSTHGQPLTAAGADMAKTIENLGGNPEDPFAVFEDVKEFYKEVLVKKSEEAAEAKAVQAKWEADNSELAAKMNSMLSGEEAVEVDFASMDIPETCATRVAGGQVLANFADFYESIIVSSADLSNSDNTGKFLARTTELEKGNFAGAFLQAGVAELTMAAIMNGLALHGGIIPVCATFFVFSDYMKPAIRMAALMELPVKFVFTHDSFRVGEDGPTHQPVEQEAQIRLLEKMANFSGQPSVTVLRPADPAEAVVAWKLAIENRNSPTVLILTRQNVTNLPAVGASRFEDALNSDKGAYIVHPEKGNKLDLVLVANGSEVGLMVESAVALEAEGKSVRVVSAPSEGLFRLQTKEYQESVIPACCAPIFGYSAGLPDALNSLVGPLGKVFGREAFGASAPASVLDEKFGFTVNAVKERVAAYLEEYKATVAIIKNN
jgi:transketolase